MTQYTAIKMMLITIAACLLAACAGVNFSRYEDVTLSPSSPSDVVFTPDHKTMLIAESGKNRITERQVSDGRMIRSYDLNIIPHAIAVSPGGGILYVACGDDSGQLYVMDRHTGDIRKKLSIGHTPCDIKIDRDGQLLYICNRFSSTVTVFDCDTEVIVDTIPLLREPIDAAITPDSRYLLVANHLPSTRQIPEYVTDGGYMDISGYKHGTDYTVSSVVMIIDTRGQRIVRMVHLPNGSTGIRGICVSPDGKYAYVSHILARYHLPTTQVERGFMNTNAFSIIELSSLSYVNTVLLDNMDRGAANPWSIECSPDGSYLYVTHAGTHELSIIDRHALHERIEKASYGIQVTAMTDNAGTIPNDLTFLSGIRNRVPLPGNGPRALAVTDSLIAITEYFTDSICILPAPGISTIAFRQFSLDTIPYASPVRDGERFFNDATFCFQTWQSCASCHPDGRTDGLNWDLLNDGIGNPKNTKSLLYSHRTPPVMVTGIRPDAETAVRAGLRHIQFIEHSEHEAEAIDAYLSSLEPIISPHLADPGIRSSAKRGKRVFTDAGCAACHPSPLFTDLASYNVGTGSGSDRTTAFDTPTLVELWRTEPYLFDGRAHSLDYLFRYYNQNDRHGNTSQLNERQRYELLCYLLTL